MLLMCNLWKVDEWFYKILPGSLERVSREVHDLKCGEKAKPAGKGVHSIVPNA